MRQTREVAICGKVGAGGAWTRQELTVFSVEMGAWTRQELTVFSVEMGAGGAWTRQELTLRVDRFSV